MDTLAKLGTWIIMFTLVGFDVYLIYTYIVCNADVENQKEYNVAAPAYALPSPLIKPTLPRSTQLPMASVQAQEDISGAGNTRGQEALRILENMQKNKPQVRPPRPAVATGILRASGADVDPRTAASIDSLDFSHRYILLRVLCVSWVVLKGCSDLVSDLNFRACTPFQNRLSYS